MDLELELSNFVTGLKCCNLLLKYQVLKIWLDVKLRLGEG